MTCNVLMGTLNPTHSLTHGENLNAITNANTLMDGCVDDNIIVNKFAVYFKDLFVVMMLVGLKFRGTNIFLHGLITVMDLPLMIPRKSTPNLSAT